MARCFAVVVLLFALIMHSASARDVPGEQHVLGGANNVPSDVGLNDQKNFVSYGGVGGYSGIGSNGLPFGGVGGLGGVNGLGSTGAVGGTGGLGGGNGLGGGFGGFGGVGGANGVVPNP